MVSRVKEIRVVDITVRVSNAMPNSLRHLEEKPFLVLESKLEAQGYQMESSSSGVTRNESADIGKDDEYNKTTTGNLRNEIDGENSSNEIFVETTPVPSILIGYRLERVIVADMLKDNAKQVLKDTFSFDSWGRSPQGYK